MEKLKVSFSALDTYETCPRKYYYNYILKLPRKKALPLKFGSFVHLVLEKFHKYIKYFKKRNADMKYGYLMKRAFESALRRYDYAKDTISEEMQLESKPMLRKYLEKIREHCPETIFIEKWFEIEIDGFILRGSIDRVDELPNDDLDIVDYKTNKKAYEVNKTHQLSLYSFAVRHMLKHRKINKITKTLNFLRLQKVKTSPDQESDVDAAVSFVKNTGGSIVKNLEKSKDDEHEWQFKENKYCYNCDFKDRCFSNRRNQQ